MSMNIFHCDWGPALEEGCSLGPVGFFLTLFWDAIHPPSNSWEQWLNMEIAYLLLYSSFQIAVHLWVLHYPETPSSTPGSRWCFCPFDKWLSGAGSLSAVCPLDYLPTSQLLDINRPILVCTNPPYLFLWIIADEWQPHVSAPSPSMNNGLTKMYNPLMLLWDAQSDGSVRRISDTWSFS